MQYILIIFFIIIFIFIYFYLTPNDRQIEKINNDNDFIINDYNIVIKEIDILEKEFMNEATMRIDTYHELVAIMKKIDQTAVEFIEWNKKLNKNIVKKQVRKYKKDSINLINRLEILKDYLEELYFIKNKIIKEQEEIREEKEEREKIENINKEKNKNKYIYFNGCKTKDDINKRYKALVKVYHPDNSTGNADIFKDINIEYNKILSEV